MYIFFLYNIRIEEAKKIAYEMLGNRLITKQTNATGQLVNKVCTLIKTTNHNFNFVFL